MDKRNLSKSNDICMGAQRARCGARADYGSSRIEGVSACAGRSAYVAVHYCSVVGAARRVPAGALRKRTGRTRGCSRRVRLTGAYVVASPASGVAGVFPRSRSCPMSNLNCYISGPIAWAMGGASPASCPESPPLSRAGRTRGRRRDRQAESARRDPFWGNATVKWPCGTRSGKRRMRDP